MPWYVLDRNGNNFAGPYNTKSEALTFGRGNAPGHSVVLRKDESGDSNTGVRIYKGGNRGPVRNNTSNSTSGWWGLIWVGIAIVAFIILKNAWDNREHVKKTYYSDGGIRTEQTYKNKKLNGPSRFYASNGKIEKESIYRDGKLNGITTKYYENGNAKSKENYKQGKLNGVSTEYYENGKIEREVTYKNDKKNGTSKVYYPNGTLRSEAMIINNQMNGVSILYDENGKVLRKENFQNGKSTNIIE